MHMLVRPEAWLIHKCTMLSYSILEPTCRTILLLDPHPSGMPLCYFTCTGDVSAQTSSAQTPANEQILSLEENHIFRNLPIDDHSDMTEPVEDIDGKLMLLIELCIYYCFINSCRTSGLLLQLLGDFFPSISLYVYPYIHVSVHLKLACLAKVNQVHNMY